MEEAVGEYREGLHLARTVTPHTAISASRWGPKVPACEKRRCTHLNLQTVNLFTWRAYLLPGSSGESPPGNR